MHDQDTGTLLRRLRLERGWTQRQAAELLGVSAQAVSKWERGQGCPDVGMLPRLAKIFGVSVEGILDGDLLPAAPDGGNMKKIQFYVCPDCGNILTAAAGGGAARRRRARAAASLLRPAAGAPGGPVRRSGSRRNGPGGGGGLVCHLPPPHGQGALYPLYRLCDTGPAAAGAAVSGTGQRVPHPPAAGRGEAVPLLLLPRAVPGEAAVRCKREDRL